MLIALESTGLHFYPRPPRGGRRARPAPTRTSMVFLSTPSARRATLIAKHGSPSKGDFYPRPPRGGRLSDVQSAPPAPAPLSTSSTCRVYTMHKNFYPRPPRGGRQLFPLFWLILLLFLSTPSARRATNLYRFIADFCVISIHALREEGDMVSLPLVHHLVISIHALREEGDRIHSHKRYPRPISIHALREEVDALAAHAVAVRLIFLSTPSARRATACS